MYGYTWEACEEAVLINPTEDGGVPDKPILVQPSEWRGQKRLDIRRYYWRDETRRFCRTKQGVPVPLEAVPNLALIAGTYEREAGDDQDATA